MPLNRYQATLFQLSVRMMWWLLSSFWSNHQDEDGNHRCLKRLFNFFSLLADELCVEVVYIEKDGLHAGIELRNNDSNKSLESQCLTTCGTSLSVKHLLVDCTASSIFSICSLNNACTYHSSLFTSSLSSQYGIDSLILLRRRKQVIQTNKRSNQHLTDSLCSEGSPFLSLSLLLAILQIKTFSSAFLHLLVNLVHLCFALVQFIELYYWTLIFLSALHLYISTVDCICRVCV
jgi:hypothetical protein